MRFNGTDVSTLVSLRIRIRRYLGTRGRYCQFEAAIRTPYGKFQSFLIYRYEKLAKEKKEGSHFFFVQFVFVHV